MRLIDAGSRVAEDVMTDEAVDHRRKYGTAPNFRVGPGMLSRLVRRMSARLEGGGPEPLYIKIATAAGLSIVYEDPTIPAYKLGVEDDIRE